MEPWLSLEGQPANRRGATGTAGLTSDENSETSMKTKPNVDPTGTPRLLMAAADRQQSGLPEINVLVAYDGFANRLYATHLLARLEETVGRLYHVVPHFLKFEVLLWPQVGRKAAQQAARADLVIIAAYEEACLPCLAKRWLREQWRNNRLTYGPLVLLLRTSARGNNSQTPVQWHLHQVAKRARKAILHKQTPWAARNAQFPVKIAWRCRSVWGDPKPIARSMPGPGQMGN